MEPILIDRTEDKPKVVLDKELGEFCFEGISMCEDSISFYTPILEWIKNYTQSPNPKTVVKIKLLYFNTASSKIIMSVLLKFEELYRAGYDVEVDWHFLPGDEDMEEAGELYASRLSMPWRQVKDDTMEL